MENALQVTMASVGSNRHDPGMVRALASTPAAALMMLLSACANQPSGLGLPAEMSPARGPLNVRLLDEWFLEADGERLAIDEFVYRFRVDCRRWAASSQGPPLIELRSAETVPQKVRMQLIDQLQLAGARQMSLSR